MFFIMLLLDKVQHLVSVLRFKFLYCLLDKLLLLYLLYLSFYSISVYFFSLFNFCGCAFIFFSYSFLLLNFLFIYSLSFSCHASQSHSFPVYSLCPCSNPHQKKKIERKKKGKIRVGGDLVLETVV